MKERRKYSIAGSIGSIKREEEEAQDDKGEEGRGCRVG